MTPLPRRLTLTLIGGGLLFSQIAMAQSGAWPAKPVKFVTPYPPGGSSDIITRFVADRVSRTLGQPVIVENKPGAGATLGTEYASRAAPDGYSFFVGPTATVAVAPFLKKVGYTPESFEPVAKLSGSYGLITARKDAPFNNYKEFVAAAKANPGKYTFGTNGVGSIVHLSGVLLHKENGIDVLHVPYKGAMESMTDLMGGRLDLMYDPATAPLLDLLAFPFVDRLKCEFRDQILDHFARREVLVRPRFRSDRDDWVQRVVAEGRGICILPERSAAAPGLVTRPIEGFALEREVVIATVSGSTAPVEIRKIAQLAARYEWS